MLTHALVCLDILEKIVKQILMIALIIHAKTVAHASIMSIATIVSVEFHILEEIVKLRWILVLQIDAKMAQNVHQAQIIKTFIVHVQLDILDACVMKISTNVNNQYHHAEMEQPVEILTDHTNVFVPKAMKERIVQLTQTIVHLIHVKMVELVSMVLEIIHACALMALRENTVKKMSMNACLSHVKMEQHASSTLILTLVIVLWASQV